MPIKDFQENFLDQEEKEFATLGEVKSLIANSVFETKAFISNSLTNFVGTTRVKEGLFQSGNFVSGSAGWRFTALGDLEANSGNFRGTITATTGAIGGWDITTGYIYGLASGTPTSSPSDGIVMASGNEGITVYENTQKRVELGYLSAGVYGLKVYADDGSTVIFELSDTQKTFDGAYLGSLSVDTGSINDLAITAGKIGNATITATQIANATITATQIANTTITATQIAANTITAGQIAGLTITASEIANNTITAGQITNGTITTTQISGTAGIIGGQIDNLTITAGNIANLTITTSQIANATIVGGDIAEETITGGASGNIAAATITGTEIAATTIAAGNIAVGTITANEIAASTITATEMNVSTLSSMAADLGSITAGNITIDSSGYIKGGQIAFNTDVGWWWGYDTDKYKMSIGDPSGQYMIWDGLLKLEASLVGDCYRYMISDDVYHSDDSEEGWSTTTYTEKKEFTLPANMPTQTMRIYFELRGDVDSSGDTYYGRIYKNDVAFGTERSTTHTSWLECTEDLEFTAGDTIQLMLKTNRDPFDRTAFVRYFRILGTIDLKKYAITTTS